MPASRSVRTAPRRWASKTSRSTCSLPGFVVIVPADEESAKAATAAMLEYKGPVYLRVGRPDVPKIYTKGPMKFEIGKANRLRDGTDVTIVANGLMVAPALDAAETLAGEGIQARVLDMHTVKPIDSAALDAAAKETGALVVAEEHLAHGGLGSVVAMTLARDPPGSHPLRQPGRPVRRKRRTRRLDRKVRADRRACGQGWAKGGGRQEALIAAAVARRLAFAENSRPASRRILKSCGRESPDVASRVTNVAIRSTAFWPSRRRATFPSTHGTTPKPSDWSPRAVNLAEQAPASAARSGRSATTSAASSTR